MGRAPLERTTVLERGHTLGIPKKANGEEDDEDDAREDGYKAEIMHRYRTLIRDQIGRTREQLT